MRTQPLTIILWRLRKLPYGITEPGRQWAKQIESWMVQSAVFGRLFGMSQIYVIRDEQIKGVIITVKVTDDILLAGSIPHLNQFSEQISTRYKVRKIIIDDVINFSGCKKRNTTQETSA